MYAIQNINSKEWLKGIRVRASVQAMAIPMGKLITVVNPQISSELPRGEIELAGPLIRGAPVVKAPAARFSKPVGSGVEAVDQNRKTGQTMKKPSDNRTAAMMKWPMRGRASEMFLAATSA